MRKMVMNRVRHWQLMRALRPLFKHVGDWHGVRVGDFVNPTPKGVEQWHEAQHEHGDLGSGPQPHQHGDVS